MTSLVKKGEFFAMKNHPISYDSGLKDNDV